jgi:hypothetical protein
MAKSFKKPAKSGWKGKPGKVPEVRLPAVLFSWAQPPQQSVTPWLSELPDMSKYDTYVELFAAHGIGWLKMGEDMDAAWVHHENQEWVSAMKVAGRGDSNFRLGIQQWMRVWGVMETWPSKHLKTWHMFHVEQRNVTSTDVAEWGEKMKPQLSMTLAGLVVVQQVEFPHQPVFFKECLKASLIATLRRAQQSASQNGEPLPEESLLKMLETAMRQAAFVYIRKLYEASEKSKMYLDPMHVLFYVLLNTWGRKNSGVGWSVREDVSFDVAEKEFRMLGAPLVHALGRKTYFQWGAALVALNRSPEGAATLVFGEMPADMTPDAFAELYDAAWKREGDFVLVATSEQAQSVSHNGFAKTWISGGREWCLMSNTQQKPVDENSGFE